MKPLTKTDFVSYKDCPHNVWVKLHEPEIYDIFEVSEFKKSLAIVGNEVEELARGMFPKGYLVERRSEGAQELTKKLIKNRTQVIIQAVFATDKYLAATDILQWNEKAGAYDLYEVKMSSTAERNDGETTETGEISPVNGETRPVDDTKKPEKINKKKEEQYERDLAFQANVLEMCGLKIHDKYLIRLNKKYIRHGDLDFTPNQLFILENKTEKIDNLMPVIKTEMDQAYEDLSSEKMPDGPCKCYYKGRISHCTAFSHINHNVPKYSVHDLNRIGSSKEFLKGLLDKGILEIDKVPEHEIPKPKKAKEGEKQSKPRKLNQVRAYKSGEPIIDLPAIKRELTSLEFPLYFLDYETYPAAVPLFNGYHPYQNIVFQYSLHVLTEEMAKKGLKPKLFECLLLDGDPAERIVESLRKNIGDKGSVISWSKKFENARNRELADFVLSSDSKFLHNIIARTYDLMDIVENQYYVHPGFKGSSSIKKVQDVLASKYSYKKLIDVQNGTDAIEAYRQISKGELIGKAVEERKRHMLKYCKYDTAVMYEIWKFFTDLVK